MYYTFIYIRTKSSIPYKCVCLFYVPIRFKNFMFRKHWMRCGGVDCIIQTKIFIWKMHSALIYIKCAARVVRRLQIATFMWKNMNRTLQTYKYSTYMYVYCSIYRKLLKPDVRYVYTIYALRKLFFISVRGYKICFTDVYITQQHHIQ